MFSARVILDVFTAQFVSTVDLGVCGHEAVYARHGCSHLAARSENCNQSIAIFVTAATKTPSVAAEKPIQVSVPPHGARRPPQRDFAAHPV